MTTKVTVKPLKGSPALSEEQLLATLDGFSLQSGSLALTNHEAEYRLQELSKATAGIKKLLAKAEEAAHGAAMADHRRGAVSKMRNEMVLRRLQDARLRLPPAPASTRCCHSRSSCRVQDPG